MIQQRFVFNNPITIMLILGFPWIYFSKSRNPSKNNHESRELEISLFLFMNEVQAGYARFPFWHSFSGARREVQDMAAVGGTIQLPQGNVKGSWDLMTLCTHFDWCTANLRGRSHVALETLFWCGSSLNYKLFPVLFLDRSWALRVRSWLEFSVLNTYVL